MSLRRIAVVLGLLALALPAFAAAQGLGDAAAREKAKRETAKKPAAPKVFTTDDLAQGRPPGAEPSDVASPSASEAASSAPEPSGPEADRRNEDQSNVQAVTAAKERVTQIEKRIQELQARLNPMSTTYVYGDLNVGGNKVAEEAEVKAELAQSQGDLNEARQAVLDAVRARDEFRQGGSGGRPR